MAEMCDNAGSSAPENWEDDFLEVQEEGDDSPFPFEDSDCECERVRESGKGSILAPDQLDKVRWRDVCTIAKVCDIDEGTAHELLVREGWDHQKVLDLHCPFNGLPDLQPVPSCPVCLESCAVSTSNGVVAFELCNHPIHAECAKEFVRQEIDSMAGMSQERYKGSVTCPWCIAHKEATPGFFSEEQVAGLISSKYFETYKQIRRSMLARNERHCTKEGCTNVVRFSSVKLGHNSCLTLECGCGHRFCLLCGCTEHWPAMCEDVAAWFRMETEIEQNTRELQRDIERTRRELREIRTEIANINIPRDAPLAPERPRGERRADQQQQQQQQQPPAQQQQRVRGGPAAHPTPGAEPHPPPPHQEQQNQQQAAQELAPPLLPEDNAPRGTPPAGGRNRRETPHSRRQRALERMHRRVHFLQDRQDMEFDRLMMVMHGVEGLEPQTGQTGDELNDDRSDGQMVDVTDDRTATGSITPTQGESPSGERGSARSRGKALIKSLRHRLFNRANLTHRVEEAVKRYSSELGPNQGGRRNALAPCDPGDEVIGRSSLDEVVPHSAEGGVGLGSLEDPRRLFEGNPNRSSKGGESGQEPGLARNWGGLGRGLFGESRFLKGPESEWGRQSAGEGGKGFLSNPWRLRKARSPRSRSSNAVQSGSPVRDREELSGMEDDLLCSPTDHEAMEEDALPNRLMGKRSFGVHTLLRDTSPNSKSKKLLKNERNSDGKKTSLAGKNLHNALGGKLEQEGAETMESETELGGKGGEGVEAVGPSSSAGSPYRDENGVGGGLWGKKRWSRRKCLCDTAFHSKKDSQQNALDVPELKEDGDDAGQEPGEGDWMQTESKSLPDEADLLACMEECVEAPGPSQSQPARNPTEEDEQALLAEWEKETEMQRMLWGSDSDLEMMLESSLETANDRKGSEVGESDQQVEQAGGEGEPGPSRRSTAVSDSIADDGANDKEETASGGGGEMQVDRAEQGGRPEPNSGNQDVTSNAGDSTTTVQDAGSNESGEEQSYIARYIKDCPRCFCLCEKMWGCDHVTCPRCAHHFCWRCRADWNNSGGYRHLEHCPGESKSLPSKEEAERQYQAFLERHGGPLDRSSGKEDFMNDWLQREKEMRTQFEYRADAPPRWHAEFGALLQERREAVMERMRRLREREAELEQRLQEQQRDMEWRKKFHVTRALQEKEGGLREVPASVGDEVRDLNDEEFASYEAVIEQGKKIDRATGLLNNLKKHQKEFQSEAYLQLAKILVSCERAIWSFRLDRFFNSERDVNQMVEFNVGELLGANKIYGILQQVLLQISSDAASEDGSQGSSSGSVALVENVNVGSLANSAEYYTRKRNNFIKAWEEMIQERRGIVTPGMCY